MAKHTFRDVYHSLSFHISAIASIFVVLMITAIDIVGNIIQKQPFMWLIITFILLFILFLYELNQYVKLSEIDEEISKFKSARK